MAARPAARTWRPTWRRRWRCSRRRSTAAGCSPTPASFQVGRRSSWPAGLPSLPSSMCPGTRGIPSSKHPTGDLCIDRILLEISACTALSACPSPLPCAPGVQKPQCLRRYTVSHSVLPGLQLRRTRCGCGSCAQSCWARRAHLAPPPQHFQTLRQVARPPPPALLSSRPARLATLPAARQAMAAAAEAGSPAAGSRRCWA